MELNLRTPPQLQGDEKAQLQQIRSYLFQMQQSLMVALDGLSEDRIIQATALAVRGGTALPDGGDATVQEAYRKLKALIIKTANTVTHEFDERFETLNDLYVASSDFGTYKQELETTVRTTAEDVLTTYDFDSQLTAANNLIGAANDAIGEANTAIDALDDKMVQIDSYNLASEQYIKTGILFYDDDGLPRVGVAVGDNLSTVTVNGQTEVKRQGLCATFIADRLSFWQNDVEVAWVASNQLFIDEARIVSRLFIGNWVIERTNGFTIKWSGA